MRRHFAFAVFAGLIGCSSEEGGNPPATPGDASTNDVGGDSGVDVGMMPTGPGSFDPTFGTAGIVQRALPDKDSGFVARLAVLAPDDGIVFDASYSTQTGLGRIGANGTLDEAFAGPSPIGGFLRSTFAIGGMAMLPDGKTMIVGSASDAANAMRVLPNGEPDPAFPRTSFFGNVVDHGGLSEAVLDVDGSVVSQGGINRGTAGYTPKVFLGRITPDAMFARFGDTTSYGGGYKYVRPQARTADGKFLCVAQGVTATAHDVILRIDTMGVIDMTFGTAGEVSTPVEYIDAFLPQTDGSFIVFGHAEAIGRQQSMARMKSDGSLDTMFGTSGSVLMPEKESDGSALALQADGKILVALGVDVGDGSGHTTTAMHRFEKSGALDLTFGLAGTAELPVTGVTSTRIGATVVQKSGRIVLIGNASVAKGPDSFVAIGVRP
jgi:uncharacterized delta-60 repeat protein